MKLHITNLYNGHRIGGMSQQKIAKIAREMGFNEMGLFVYNTNVDNDVEMGKRIDGILPALGYGDIVFIQSPSCNGMRFDSRLVHQIKAYRDVKIVFIIHDIIQIMTGGSERSICEIVELYNYADLIIAPSKEMLKFLCKYGLNVKKQMTQEVWDYPIEYEGNVPVLKRKLLFTGGPARFRFINSWNKQTKLYLYSDDHFEQNGLNVEVKGFLNEYKFFESVSEGGYGLVWSSDEAYDYYKMLQPYKVATYLVAGIPIIMQRGLAPEEIILKNGLGYVVDSLEEADAIVQNVTEAEYNEMVKRISEFNFLIKNGWFTRKLLTDAVMWLLNDNYKPE